MSAAVSIKTWCISTFALLVVCLCLLVVIKRIIDTKMALSVLDADRIANQVKLHCITAKVIKSQLAIGLLNQSDLSLKVEALDSHISDLEEERHDDKQQLVEICKTAYSIYTNNLKELDKRDDEISRERCHFTLCNEALEDCIMSLKIRLRKHEIFLIKNHSKQDNPLLDEQPVDAEFMNCADFNCTVQLLSQERQMVAKSSKLDTFDITANQSGAFDCDFLPVGLQRPKNLRFIWVGFDERIYSTSEDSYFPDATTTIINNSEELERLKIRNIFLYDQLASAQQMFEIIVVALEKQIKRDAVRIGGLVTAHRDLIARTSESEKCHAAVDQSVMSQLFLESDILKAKIASLAAESVLDDQFAKGAMHREQVEQTASPVSDIEERISDCVLSSVSPVVYEDDPREIEEDVTRRVTMKKTHAVRPWQQLAQIETSMATMSAHNIQPQSDITAAYSMISALELQISSLCGAKVALELQIGVESARCEDLSAALVASGEAYTSIKLHLEDAQTVLSSVHRQHAEAEYCLTSYEDQTVLLTAQLAALRYDVMGLKAVNRTLQALKEADDVQIRDLKLQLEVNNTDVYDARRILEEYTNGQVMFESPATPQASARGIDSCIPPMESSSEWRERFSEDESETGSGGGSDSDEEEGEEGAEKPFYSVGGRVTCFRTSPARHGM